MYIRIADVSGGEGERVGVGLQYVADTSVTIGERGPNHGVGMLPSAQVAHFVSAMHNFWRHCAASNSHRPCQESFLLTTISITELGQ